jgi:hypothetical protein
VGSTWSSSGLRASGDMSCNGDSDEGLGESFFDARTGPYDELDIGGTGGNVFTSRFGLGPSALHEEGGMMDTDCAAPDLSCDGSFCGDSDALAERSERQDAVVRPRQGDGGADVQSPGCDSDTAPDKGLGGGALGDGWWVGNGGNDRQAQKRYRKSPTTAVTAADVIAGVGCSGRGSSAVMPSGQCRTCSLCGRTGHNRRTCPQTRLSHPHTDGLKPDAPTVLQAQLAFGSERMGEGWATLWAGTRVEALYDNGQWYEGVIESHDSTTGRYKITFPDGESVTTPLPDDNFRVISWTRPAGPLQSDGSLASNMENGKICCAPAPACSGSTQVFMMAATGGGECYVARPLDYAQACLLPRPISWYTS